MIVAGWKRSERGWRPRAVRTRIHVRPRRALCFVTYVFPLRQAVAGAEGQLKDMLVGSVSKSVANADAAAARNVTGLRPNEKPFLQSASPFMISLRCQQNLRELIFSGDHLQVCSVPTHSLAT